MSTLSSNCAYEQTPEAQTCLAAARISITENFVGAAKAKLTVLRQVKSTVIRRPVALVLSRLIVACNTGDSKEHDAMQRAGVAHGRARARIEHYTTSALVEEYALLRNHMWRALSEAELPFTERLVQLQTQIDLVSILAIQAFEAARASGKRPPCDAGWYGPLIGGLTDPFWKYNAETDVLLWGQELVTAWGYPPSARRCNLAWWIERIHPADRQRVIYERHSHLLAESLVGVYSYRWKHAQGHYVCVADRVYRVHNATGMSRVSVGMMVACDWPSLTHAQPNSAPRTQPRPQSDKVVPLASCLMLIDTQRRFVYANQVLLDYWQLSMNELRGRRLEDIIGADGYALLPNEAPRVFEGSLVSFEAPFRDPAGEARWRLLNYLPYRDNNAVVQGFVCHVTDLHLFVTDGEAGRTSSQRFSQQYQMILTDLEHYLNAPASDSTALGASKQRIADLEDQQLARERFVTMLTHDLRNPLAAARLTAERLMRKNDGRIADTWAARSTKAQRLISHLDRADCMITDLLLVNRLQSGAQFIIDGRPLDLGCVVDDVVLDFSPGADRVVVLEHKAPLEGEWDAKAVRRILENLLSNAVKYGDPNKPITVSLTKQKHKVLLCVHNWGEPLPRQGRDVLFHPFERTIKAARSGQPGWGIGLALVRGLAEAHGGGVCVTSSQKGGTSFCVTLSGGSAVK